MSGRVPISQLIHRITIQELTVVTNENGFDEETWSDLMTVWSRKENLSGREFWAAKVVQGELTVGFGVRYGKWVDTLDSRTNRIVHGTKIYNITFVDNVEFQGKFVRIKTLELIP